MLKRARAFIFILAVGAILGGCNKDKSRTATQETGASAVPAASAPDQAASGMAAASGATASQAAPSAITQAQLPGEATETLRLIKKGGPFPFAEDGVLFRNSAGSLPQHPRGYYRAYTVRTPGATDRGLRRIVCGGPRGKTVDCYYTEDYYASFKRIEN